MSLGDRGREATLANAVSLSARFGLSQKEAQFTIEETKLHVATWEEQFTSHAVSSVDIEAIRACFMGAETVI
jgi:serine/threonine-protein kinase HipA